MQDSDLELIARTLQGESAAFDTLWKRYEPAVLGLCRQFLEGPHRDPALEAQDLANETFVRALHFLYRYEDRTAAGADFGDWLLEIARRVCLKCLARQRRRNRLLGARQPDAPPSLHDSHADAAMRAVVDRDTLRAAVQAINALPPNYRVPFKLSLEERSHREIAAALGISVETAAKRVQRARGLLRPRLEALFGAEPVARAERRERQPRGMLGVIERALTGIVGEYRIIEVSLPSAGQTQLCIRVRTGYSDSAPAGRSSRPAHGVRQQLAYAESCYYRGEWTEAREEYRLALAQTPGCFEAALRLGEMLVHEGRPAEAADIYRSALQENPQPAVAVALQAHLLAAEERYEAAAEAFQYALELNPGDAGLHFGLHGVLGRLSRFERQIQNLARLRERRPEHLEAYVHVYTPCARLQRWDIALPLLEQALQIDPNYPLAVKHLFQVRMNLGLCDAETGALAERLVHLAPDFVDSWSQLAWFHAEQGRSEESLAVLHAFLLEHPDNSEAHAALSWRYHYQGRDAESREHAARAYVLEPQNWHNCWTMLASHGSTEAGFTLAEADALTLDIASRFPSDAFVMECIAQFHAGWGQADQALRYAAKAQALNPTSPLPYAARASILHRFGRYAGAAAAWQELLALPGGRTASYLGALARSLAAMGAPECAAAFAEATAAARTPYDWTMLAVHLEAAGRDRAAAEAYCRCLDLDPPGKTLRTLAVEGLKRTAGPASNTSSLA